MRLIILFLTGLLLVSCGKSEIETVLNSFSGDVLINSNMRAQAGMKIKAGDVISVGENSFCIIVINEKNVIRLNSGSLFRFNADSRHNILELEKGWMSGVFRKKFTKNGIFRIKTPTVTASVRGTSVCTRVEKPDSTYFCVCNGAVSLSSEDVEKLESAHHSAIRFVKKQSSIIKTRPGLLYHDDKTLEDLAAVIGEKMDWEKMEK